MRVCVYGASSSRIAAVYKEAGRELGILMADADMTLIFGGGQTGMMGAVLEGIQAAGEVLLPYSSSTLHYFLTNQSS